MKKTRMPQRLLSLVLVLMMLISVLPVSAMAAELTPSDPETGLTATDVTNELTDSDRLAIFEDNMDSGKVSRSEIPADDEMVKVIVQLDADSLLDVRNRTNASMSMLDFQQTDAAKAQLKDIANLQLSVMNTMESKGIPSSFTFSYTSVVSGFAAQVPYGRINDIKKLDGVVDVVLCQTYYTDSMGSATLGQALTAAEVAAYSNNTQYQGEGMLIGILEHLPLEHVPLALQPGVPQPPGQGLQLAQIVRLLFQQGPVVGDLGGDEHIVIGVFPRLEPPVDEQALDIAVPRPAGVAGVIQPLGKFVDAPETGRELPQPLLLQLGGLVQEDHVVFRPLIAVHIAVGGAVAEVQDAAVGENELPGGGPVFRETGQLLPQKADVVGFQLLIGPAHQQQTDPRIAQGQQLGLGADGPAFAAAPGPAEGHILLPAPQKLLLPGVGPVHGENFFRHTLQSSVSSASSTRTTPPGCCPSRVC